MKTTSYALLDIDDDITEDSPDVIPSDMPLNTTNDFKKAVYRQFRLTNPMMVMRKLINHPFTVHCPVVPGTREIVIDEEVVTQSGKMMVLDAMLNKLKARGHKVKNKNKYKNCKYDKNSKKKRRKNFYFIFR